MRVSVFNTNPFSQQHFSFFTPLPHNPIKVVFDEELWVLGIAEHCEDCVYYAGMDWQPIGTVPTPGDGSTQCIVNCYCHKEYHNSRTGDIYSE